MKKSVKLLILVFVLLLLTGLYFTLCKFSISEETVEEQIYAATLDTKKITAVEWNYMNETISVIRKDGLWVYNEDPDFPLSQDTFKNMINSISRISSLRVVDEKCSDFSQYGLDNGIIINIKTNNDMITYKVGNADTHSQYYYFCSSNDNMVHLVESSVYNAFNKNLLDLAKIEEFPEVEMLYRYEVNSSSTDILITAGPNNSLSVNINDEDVPVTSDSSRLIINSLRNMRFSRCVDYKGNYEKFGLDEPSYVINVSFAYENGDDNIPVKDSYTLLVGSLDENNYYYTCFEGDKQIYIVDCSLLQALLITDSSSIIA